MTSSSTGNVDSPPVGMTPRPSPLSHITTLPHGLLIQLHDIHHTFNSLIDTGATHSFIDVNIVQHFNIPVLPSHGLPIELASLDHPAPRIGITPPLAFTPIFVHTTLKPQKPHTYSFELLKLPTHRYQFIIGMDLLRLIFHRSIPMSLLPPKRKDEEKVVSSLHLSSPTSDSTSILLPSSFDVTSSDGKEISSLEGAGVYPAADEPERVSTSTPGELEANYKIERDKILSDPEIQAALHRNSQIHGFCNIPESILKLKLDPIKGTPKNLYRRQYHIPESVKGAADAVIKRWLAEGRIVEAPPKCQYNNPITIAPKKDENGNLTGIRVCLDVRQLNLAIVENDRFEIPLIRDVLDNMKGCIIFGEFDLAEAYLQFELHPDSRPYTAFTWGRQQLMFVGIPFGILEVPSHFQRIMMFVFYDVPSTFPYFDNIPYGSRSWSDHRNNTLAIIERLNRYNLRIKPSSIKIGQSQLSCLGHSLNGTGVMISPDKLKKINEWPRPVTGKQLASFLGLITFVRHHVRHFADLTAELESMKRTKKELIWSPSAIKSFETIKHAIATSPTLVFPDFNRPFYIAIDASCVGIGGILYQPKHPDEDIHSNNIVAICSRKLNDTQRRYSAYKKELFAIVYALRQFHQYIWGHREVIIITDHMPLTHIFTSSTLAHALQQWLDVILDYHFTIKHRPGILHVLPDALSRMYEACYTSPWGVPRYDPHSVIQELQLPVDRQLEQSIMKSPAEPSSSPLVTIEQITSPTSTSPRQVRSIHVSATPQSQDQKFIDLTESDNDSDHESGMEPIEDEPDPPDPIDPQGRLAVNHSNIEGAGYGLFALQDFGPAEVICDYGGELIDLNEYWERYPNMEARYVVHIGGNWYRDAANDYTSFGRYANTAPRRNNARLACNTRTRTARLVATRRIRHGNEIILAYGIGNPIHRRGSRAPAISVSVLRVIDGASHPHDQEEKIETEDEDGDSILSSSSPISLSPSDRSVIERQLLVELERRGMVDPGTEAERLKLIDETHAMGHFGRDAIYRTLFRDKKWWPGMRADIQRRIRSCLQCLRHNIIKYGFDPEPLFIQAFIPFDHIQLDFATGLPESDTGLRAFLVLVDVCTSFVLIRALPTTQAVDVAPVLWQIFCDFGFPLVLQSDNGPHFINATIKRMNELSGIDHRKITPYNPRADGKVERAIGIIKNIIKKMLTGVKDHWPYYLPFAQASINNKISEITGSTPFSLMFGRKWNKLTDYTSTEIQTPLSETQLVELHQRMAETVYPTVAERVAAGKGKMVGRMKQRPKGEFKKDDIVMVLREEAASGKPLPMLDHRYVGPFKIISKQRNGTFHLVGPAGDPYPIAVRPHHLKLVERDVRSAFKRTYVVDKILEHKGEPGNYEYKVRWHGYGPEDDSWVHESDFHTDEIIQNYWRSVTPASVTLPSSDDEKSSSPEEGSSEVTEEQEEIDDSSLPSSSLPSPSQHRRRRRRPSQ